MRIVARAALGAAAAVLVFAADAAWLRVRQANRGGATASVEVRVMLAIPQKSGRIEYMPGGTETQPCLQSLFQHGGIPPCWHLRRHTRKQISY